MKGLYDGVGRVKMSGASFDARIMTSVKSGVIVSGQEMPTADPALFSRCLFCRFRDRNLPPKSADALLRYARCRSLVCRF